MMSLITGLYALQLLVGLLILSLVIGPHVICRVSLHNIHDDPYNHEEPEENDGLEAQQESQEAVANGRVPAHWAFAVGIRLHKIGPDDVATKSIVFNRRRSGNHGTVGKVAARLHVDG